MQPYLTDQFYNPSSPYMAAKQVRVALEDARARVAHWLGAKTSEIVYTAGATESINQAIHGVMRAHPNARVAMSAIEHEAVRAAASQYNHTVIPVKPDGTVNLDALKTAITDDTVLVSVGYANNEVGTIQPLKDVAAAVHEARRLRQLKNNRLPLHFHTDASQAACYLDLHVSRLGVDLMTLNGGKMYGPKQTGVLFVKAGVQLEPLLHGGGQEGGLRSGTENVAGAVGLAAALDIAQNERKEAIEKARRMRDHLQNTLGAITPQPIFNGNQKRRLPNLLHLSVPGVDGERLLMLLDERGVMASTGSACAANKQTASHVLTALGLESAAIQGSLRLTVGRPTTPEETARAADIIIKAVNSLRPS